MNPIQIVGTAIPIDVVTIQILVTINISKFHFCEKRLLPQREYARMHTPGGKACSISKDHTWLITVVDRRFVSLLVARIQNILSCAADTKVVE
jgi:hypothetical protein